MAAVLLRIGHRDDDGRLLALLHLRDGRVVRERLADLAPHLVDHLAEDLGVGPREVDVLEDALAHAPALREVVALVLAGGQPLAVDDEHLAGRDVAHVARPDEVEGAGLARHAGGPRAVAVCDLAERERAEAVRVADGDEGVVGQNHERERTLDLRERVEHLVDAAGAAALRDQVEDEFAVGRRLKQRTALLEALPQLARVREVAVVAERDVARLVVDDEGLHVGEVVRRARRRVADMADGAVAEERLGEEALVAEDVEHEAEVAVDGHHAALAALVVGGGHDARALLPAVLERVEAVVRLARGVAAAEDAEDAAVFLDLSHRKAGRGWRRAPLGVEIEGRVRGRGRAPRRQCRGRPRRGRAARSRCRWAGRRRRSPWRRRPRAT